MESRRSSSRLIAQQQAKALKTPVTQTSNSHQGVPTKSLNSAAKAAVVNAEEIQKLTEKYNKESHQRRLEFLKRQIYFARRDNWLYSPIESILSGSEY